MTMSVCGLRCGITDFDRKYELLDLASGDVMFAGCHKGNHVMVCAVFGRGWTHSLACDED